MRWLKPRHRWRWTAVRRHLTDHNGRRKPISAEKITSFVMGDPEGSEFCLD